VPALLICSGNVYFAPLSSTAPCNLKPIAALTQSVKYSAI